MNQDDLNTSLLGRGWGFPPTFDKQKGGVLMTEDEEDIKRSLEILLNTTLGERVMRPDYGSNLAGATFEPLDNSLKSLIKTNIEEAIYIHEPRIIPEEILLEEDSTNGILQVTIEFTIPQVNSRLNVVYPFYIQEATAIQ